MSGGTMNTSGSGLGGMMGDTTGADTTGTGTSGNGTTGASGQVATDAMRDLIASDKVEGTAVYNRSGERLGTAYDFMVDKRSGQVAYAVMSFGGFLGRGGSHHPLPWKVLTYDTNPGGQVVDLSREQLQGAPSCTGGARGGATPAARPAGSRVTPRPSASARRARPIWGGGRG